MRDVVNSGGAATDFGEWQLHKLKVGNGAEQRAGRFANFLAVEQVTGVLVGYALPDGFELRDDAERGKKFCDVAGFVCEGLRLRVFGFVFGEEMIVFLEWSRSRRRW